MIRWGILGTGFISETMASAISASPRSRIAAVSSRNEKQLHAFADRHSIDARHETMEQLLDDPQIDIVYVGLPNHLHHVATKAAAQRGKAVLTEKSLTTTMAEAHELAEAVRKADTFFLEGLMYLCHPFIEKLTEVIAAGTLGRIRTINATYAADIWRVANPMGRGTIYNLGCYPASLVQLIMREAFGAEMFLQRSAKAFGNVSSEDGNIIDAALLLRFSNGAMATLKASDSFGLAFDVGIKGERGMLTFRSNPWLPVAGPNTFEVEIYGKAPETFTVETGLDAFGHQVRVVENCLKAGQRQAPKPAPDLQTSLDIMGLLTEWEHLCRS